LVSPDLCDNYAPKSGHETEHTPLFFTIFIIFIEKYVIRLTVIPFILAILADLEPQFVILTNNCNIFLFSVKLNLKNLHEIALAL
jgi:hypothetical protein